MLTALRGLLLGFAIALASLTAPTVSAKSWFSSDTLPTIARQSLPEEALVVLQKIQQQAEFSSSRDGSTFGNYEKILPKQRRGYYREYTVPTPGARNRGARRIVAGGQPPEVFYYTSDHYRSFSKILP